MPFKQLQCTNTTDPVIVVDDNPIDTNLTKRLYQRSNLPNPLILFDGGDPFLDYMEKVQSGEVPMPALVLLDINMPGMNGFETLCRMREVDTFKDIPIIIMFTNSDSMDDIQKSKECGADGFQTKPSFPKEFVAFFNSLLPQESSI